MNWIILPSRKGIPRCNCDICFSYPRVEHRQFLGHSITRSQFEALNEVDDN